MDEKKSSASGTWTLKVRGSERKRVNKLIADELFANQADVVEAALDLLEGAPTPAPSLRTRSAAEAQILQRLTTYVEQYQQHPEIIKIMARMIDVKPNVLMGLLEKG